MTTEQSPREVSFASGATTCVGKHVPAGSDALAGPDGRPVVVMAHGFGGTVDSGLLPFAARLAAAGLHVLAFDYRGFGASQGEPRQTVSVQRQLEDYRAAMAAACGLDDVDTSRLVLWGVSLAGGHVLQVAAGRRDVAAVVALTPLVSGAAAGRLALQHHPVSSVLRSTVEGVASTVGGRVGRPRMMPIVGRPGERAALTLEGQYEAYHAIAGPTWRNEVDAAVGLELGRVAVAKVAGEVTAPVLVQVADSDRSAPLQAAMKVAEAARAQVRHYDGDHFDVYAGMPWFEAVVAHQVSFLTRTLQPAPAPAPL